MMLSSACREEDTGISPSLLEDQRIKLGWERYRDRSYCVLISFKIQGS